MKVYSVDLRERIVRAIANGTPQAVVATTFDVAAPPSNDISTPSAMMAP